MLYNSNALRSFSVRGWVLASSKWMILPLLRHPHLIVYTRDASTATVKIWDDEPQVGIYSWDNQASSRMEDTFPMQRKMRSGQELKQFSKTEVKLMTCYLTLTAVPGIMRYI